MTRSKSERKNIVFCLRVEEVGHLLEPSSAGGFLLKGSFFSPLLPGPC